MNQQDYNKAVIAVTRMIVANNPGAVARALRQAGYPTQDRIPSGDMEAALLQIHAINPQKYYDTLKSVSWNYGNSNWTNEPKYRDEIIKLIGNGAQVAKGEWFQMLLGMLMPQAPKAGSITYTPPRGAGFYIGMGLVAVAIIGLIWYGINQLSKA